MTNIFDVRVYDAQIDSSAVRDKDGNPVEVPTEIFMSSIKERYRYDNEKKAFTQEIVGYSVFGPDKGRYELAKTLNDEGILQNVVSAGSSYNLDVNADNTALYEKYKEVDLAENEVFIKLDKVNLSVSVSMRGSGANRFPVANWRLSAEKARELQKPDSKG